MAWARGLAAALGELLRHDGFAGIEAFKAGSEAVQEHRVLCPTRTLEPWHIEALGDIGFSTERARAMTPEFGYTG